jgi:subtilisin family serine protease
MQGNIMKIFRSIVPSFKRRSSVVVTFLLMFSVFTLFQFRGKVVNANTSIGAPGKSASKIAPEVVSDTADGGRASVVIFLADQADVRAAYEIKDEDARGWFVYNTLTSHAERSQADIKAFLTARKVSFQSFWVANMLVARVDRALAEEIASRSDVARVDSNRPARWVEDPAIADFHDSTDAPQVTEWGINNVNAPSVWSMGFTGQGMVIANQDTGMRWTHSAIKGKYRGWNGTTANHNFNWHDSIHSGGGSCGPNMAEPCDDHGHGTHTTGTTVGDDGSGNQVGVAPGAKWVGCRNMNVGDGTPATYSECFQFFIAPTDLSGNNANPSLRPHVMNNSWGCPDTEGCVTGGELETIVNNTQAAGIFVEVSAGNSGSGCSTVADAPAIYNASFSTGAIDISNTLAGFSSRGPSLFYTPSLLKPNISAPGVNVRSTTRTSDTSYGSLSGTSMAGPHVAGVVALLWSARPQLVRDIAATKMLLQNTANPSVTVSGGTQTCGGIPSTVIPNNSFGYGRVDALAAVNAAASTPTNTPTFTPTSTPLPVVSGTVTYGNAIGSPATRFLSNVLVSGAGSPAVSATTNSAGAYSLQGFGAGSYTITPSKSGGQNGAVSSFDAARIAQYIVGNTTFSAAQQTVADVSNAGGISSFDAGLIARFAISSPPYGSTGNWIFNPASNTHPSINNSINGEDYTALLMGVVSGNWVVSGARITEVNGPVKAARIGLPRVTTRLGENVLIPVMVYDAVDKGIISGEFELRYDPSMIRPQAEPVSVTGTVSRGFSIVSNTTERGVLRIAIYGTMPLAESGVLMKLKFTAIGKPGSAASLKWTRIMLNEGLPVTTVDGQLEISAAATEQTKSGRWLSNDISLLISN